MRGRSLLLRLGEPAPYLEKVITSFLSDILIVHKQTNFRISGNRTIRYIVGADYHFLSIEYPELSMNGLPAGPEPDGDVMPAEAGGSPPVDTTQVRGAGIVVQHGGDL